MSAGLVPNEFPRHISAMLNWTCPNYGSADDLRNWVESGHFDEPTRRSVGTQVEPFGNPRKRASPGIWCRGVRITRSSRRPFQRS
jgi:hypothetical protein